MEGRRERGSHSLAREFRLVYVLLAEVCFTCCLFSSWCFCLVCFLAGLFSSWCFSLVRFLAGLFSSWFVF